MESTPGQVKIKSSVKKSKASTKPIQPESEIEEGEIKDDQDEILDELIVTNVVRRKEKKEKLKKIPESNIIEDTLISTESVAEVPIVQNEEESQDLVMEGTAGDEAPDTSLTISKEVFSAKERKKAKKCSSLAQSEVKQKLPKVKTTRASKIVLAASSEDEDTKILATDDVTRLNEREIELQGLLAATQAELNAIKSKKLKLQSNTSLGSKSPSTKEKNRPNWSVKNYHQMRDIVTKQPHFDRLEIELDWNQITRIMNEAENHATPIESTLVEKYGKRLRKREVLKKESKVKPQITVQVQELMSSGVGKTPIVVEEVGVFEKVKGFFGF